MKKPKDTLKIQIEKEIYEIYSSLNKTVEKIKKETENKTKNPLMPWQIDENRLKAEWRSKNDF